MGIGPTVIDRVVSTLVPFSTDSPITSNGTPVSSSPTSQPVTTLSSEPSAQSSFPSMTRASSFQRCSNSTNAEVEEGAFFQTRPLRAASVSVILLLLSSWVSARPEPN